MPAPKGREEVEGDVRFHRIMPGLWVLEARRCGLAGGCDRFYLSHVFSEQVGVPPADFQNKILVAKPCLKLVREPDRPLELVAQDVAWPTWPERMDQPERSEASRASLVIRHFRRTMGVPGAFRADLKRLSPGDRRRLLAVAMGRRIPQLARRAGALMAAAVLALALGTLSGCARSSSGDTTGAGGDIAGSRGSGGEVSGAGGDTSSGAGGTSSGVGGDTSSGAGGTSSGAGGGASPALLAGNWTGLWSTDGTFGLSFVVTETGQLWALSVTDAATACGSTGDVEARQTGTQFLAPDGSFGLTVTGCGPNVRCYTDRIEGTLAADGTARGILIRYGACNLTCTSATTGGGRTWMAARDCSARPRSGWSATRFCDAGGTPQPETGMGGASGSSVSCSVMPSGTGGRPGVGGAVGTGVGGIPGTPVTDLGEPCTSSYCVATASWCYANDVSSCDSQWCVGSGAGMFCSKSCASDTDCSGGPVAMRCLLGCNLPGPSIAGHCWDVATFPSVSSSCGQ